MTAFQPIIQGFSIIAIPLQGCFRLMLLAGTLGLAGCGDTRQEAVSDASSQKMALDASMADAQGEGLVAQNTQAAATTTDQKVVVYTARKEHLVADLFAAFTAETGIEVDYITDKAQPLIARMKAEGARTPADLFIAVDAGNLWQAANQDLLSPVKSEVLSEQVPIHLRDSKNRWFGLSLRARTLVYSTERLKPEGLSTYEALAESGYKGRLCLRTSKKVYNQSLVATLIARLGIEEAERIVSGWVANLATEVFSNDTAVIKAVIAGQCDVGIVNSYYYGALLKEQPDIPVALFWANQKTNGVHINISGAGVTKEAKNPQGALRLLEWMVSEKAQKLFALSNYEYPVVEAVPPSELVRTWGEFKADQVPIEMAGKHQADAIKVMDRASYK